MRTTLYIYFCSLGLFLFYGCLIRKAKDNSTDLRQKIRLEKDSTNQFSTGKFDSILISSLKPVLGYRFEITGDFDGDGKKETLTEHFLSTINMKETNKYFESDSLSDDQLVRATVNKYPISIVTCDNILIDTLYISSGGQLLGLSFLKNEGDLNGDGNDEISYVINWADCSNLNTCYLITYKNRKWKELFSFPIWDWQIPHLPQTSFQYGLFSPDNDTIFSLTNDSINRILEKRLAEFPGLIKKIKTNKIQIKFRNEDSMEDSTIVDLKRRKKNNGW